MNRLPGRFELDEPIYCRIHIRGYVRPDAEGQWSSLRVSGITGDEGPESLLAGELSDQAELLGIINHLADLGHAIISLECSHGALPL